MQLAMPRNWQTQRENALFGTCPRQPPRHNLRLMFVETWIPRQFQHRANAAGKRNQFLSEQNLRVKPQKKIFEIGHKHETTRSVAFPRGIERIKLPSSYLRALGARKACFWSLELQSRAILSEFPGTRIPVAIPTRFIAQLLENRIA